MDLTAATPREIDTELARLDGEFAKLESQRNGKIEHAHSLNGERKIYDSRKGRWAISDDDTLTQLREKLAGGQLKSWEVDDVTKYLAAIDALAEQMAANRAACEPLDAEYDARPWQRFFLVQDGHIHAGQWCKGGSIQWSTRVGWQPELSDKDEAAAVAELGPLLCTKCFPSAPVEYTRGPEKKIAEGYCTGQGQRGEKLQMMYASPRGVCPECGQPVGVTSTGKVRRHKLPK